MNLTEIAQQLKQAENSKQPCAPIREHLNEKDLESAYKIQQLNIEKEVNSGKKIVGKKIGLTSKKVQEQLGVDQPDFGILLDSMEISANEEVDFSEFMQPKVETEIAFVLKEDLLKTNHSIEEIEKAIDYAVIAIEIVGSRIENWNIKITDTIADNASSSHFVLGTQRVALDQLNVVNSKMQMFINEEIVSEGDGNSCLGNPLNAVVWLANKMAEMKSPLKKGELILSGALGPMAVFKKGDTISANIEGLGDLQFSTK